MEIMIIEKACVATDGSDVAVRAAQMAVLLAHAGARRIVALSVAQPQFSMAPDTVSIAGLQAQAAHALDAAHAHVDTVARIAMDGGVSCEKRIRLASNPGPEIVRIAEEEGCDLIVMGAHGPNDLNRLATGSVARYVLAWSSIPVLVLRDPREASKPEFSDAPRP
jgi:nucleotide-binding universal stress UspA family protein